MKKPIKSILKYIATLSLVAMFGLSYGQELSDRQIQAEDELIELQQINKKSLTKAEKQAWKRKVKRLKFVIRQEEDRAAYERYVERSRRFGRPVYAYGSPYLNNRIGRPIYGSPYTGGYYNQPVVVVRRRQAPVCRYPSSRP